MRKFLVSGGVAIAAAAVSLCCGGAAANAQEVSTGHVSAQVVNHVKEATAGVLRNAQQRDVQQKSPMVLLVRYSHSWLILLIWLVEMC